MTVVDSQPVELVNEFAAVTVVRVRTRNGVRLRIESQRTGGQIELDPLELEALTLQTHDLFTQLLSAGPDLEHADD